MMAGYVRKTVLAPGEVLLRAEEILPVRIGLSRSKASGHGATYTGEEGTVILSAHAHSHYTEVTVQTDRLRTSRMDYEIQKFMNRLPYEAEDRGGPGDGDPKI
ncbi:MAG: hypothetical protein EA421_03625 [Gemmatimonadales bacterium]|nr:MAG: hypothetical protein EA421_03625 [Gemmatimonadales bacterium]